MTAPAIARAVLVGNAGVTALVPASNIIADEVVPGDVGLPLILIKLVSGFDMNPLTPAATVFVRQRVQVEVHAADAPARKAIKKAVRRAGLSNPAPDLPGYGNITMHTEGEGPDFTVGTSSVRIGEQDFIITFSETI